MNRYSPGHTVLHAGAYLLPMLPMVLVAARYDSSAHEITGLHVSVLWGVGFGISYLLILAHELGHLAVARLIGLEISHLTVGHWRRLISFRLGSLTVTLRAAPDSGSVQVKPSARMLPMSHMFAFFAAGMLVEAGLVWCALGFFDMPREVGSFAELLAAFSLTAVISLGLIQIIVSLWPGTAQVGGDRIPNDGMQMLALWRDRKNRPEQFRMLGEFAALNTQLASREWTSALATAKELVERYPENIELSQCLFALHTETGDTRQAEVIGRELISKPLGAEKLAEVLDSLACIPLYNDRPDLLTDALRWTTEAIGFAPAAITLKGTRGSILVELGRVAEGEPLLREVIRRSECPVDQAISSAYLAKTHALRGELEEARRWLAKAIKLDPEQKVVRRIRSELELA